MTKAELRDNLVRLGKPHADSPFMDLVQQTWAHERERIESEGKKHQRSEDWAKLDGFDIAISVVTGALYPPQKTRRQAPPDPTEDR